MIIRWHGHSCFEIDDEEDTILVTDPHDGRSIGIKPPLVTADVVLVSHDHFDHSSARTVSNKDTRIISREGRSKFREIRINGIPSYHDMEEGKKRGKNTIFQFTMQDLSICHLGDLGHPLDERTIKNIGPVDILFIPVGGVFTLDAEGAVQVSRSIHPHIVIPMHYRIGGLSIPVDPVDRFREMAGHTPIIKVGSEIDFFKDELPGAMTIWEFSL